MKQEATTIENRRRIYDYVRNNPGTHLRKLSRDLGIDLGALRHNLDYLERMGVLVSRREQNLRTYFTTEMGSEEKRPVSNG